MLYMIFAGEASGDLHASRLIQELKKADPDARFVFYGGDRMAAAAGTRPAVHIRDMAFMGFSEVIKHLPQIQSNLSLAKKLIDKVRPDAVILVDYPSFNLKIARHAKSRGIRTFYYISPKVWAWKEWRVSTIRSLVDRMFVIFPFEEKWYEERHKMRVFYVGNPSVAEIDDTLTRIGTREEFNSRHALRNRPLIALLPGSRRGEIRNNLPIMAQAVRQFPQYSAVIAGAPNIENEFYEQFTVLPVVRNETTELLAHSRAALVTSGTATLEAALVGTPQVACYRSNGSQISYNIMQRLLTVDYVTLPNLIAGREIIPELLLHKCSVDSVAIHLATILPDREPRRRQTEGYAEMRRCLGTKDAAQEAARSIVAYLRGDAQ